MRKKIRWSHNLIYDLLQKKSFANSHEIDYWIMKDYTHAEILRRSSTSGRVIKRTIGRGLWFIKRDLTRTKKFKEMKAKVIMGGIQVECSPSN